MKFEIYKDVPVETETTIKLKLYESDDGHVYLVVPTEDGGVNWWLLRFEHDGSISPVDGLTGCLEIKVSKDCIKINKPFDNEEIGN